MTDSVQYKINPNGVADIIINRPERHNAFDIHIINLLTKIIQAASSDNKVKVLVLQSTGKTFSAGADIQWMCDTAKLDYKHNHEDASKLSQLMLSLWECPKPVICKIQGPAYGGALGLICCSDISIASHHAQFCFSEVKIGILPAVISPYVISCIGQSNAKRYFLSAEPIDAEKAVQIGLIQQACAPEELEENIEKLTAQLLKNSPQAMREVKALIRQLNSAMINEDNRNLCTDLIAKIRVSNEGQEGLQAFLEKRSADWNKFH